MTTFTHEALLHLQGPDAAKFLQGQTTADFLNAAPNSLLRGAFCNPKGRVLADFLAAVISHENIWLRSRRAVAEHLVAHLERYLMFSRATLTLTDWAVSADRVDADNGPSLEPDQGLMVIPRGATLTEYWSAPDHTAPGRLTESAFQVQEIAIEEARIEKSTIGAYLPQDLNYDLNEAVSFKKGCYTGQEIIARLHFRGTPKRRLYLAQCTVDAELEPGAVITAADTEKTLGSVVNSAATEHGAVMLIEAVETVFEQHPRLGEKPIKAKS
jgi:folate-binding protein YgfZ